VTAESPGPAGAGEGRDIAIIGVGYVGLPTAATLAHLGHRVVCGDRDEARIEMLRRGEMPILEAGLEQLVRTGMTAGRLRFVTGAARAAETAEFVFLCVPTPQNDDGSADLSYVEAVAREIGPVLRPGAVVVNKSTVPVGSTLVVERVLADHEGPLEGVETAPHLRHRHVPYGEPEAGVRRVEHVGTGRRVLDAVDNPGRDLCLCSHVCAPIRWRGPRACRLREPLFIC